MTDDERAFPAGFLWGAATASYQIEGAAGEDGRGPSIWDTFAATLGKVADGDTGAVACDHYHRYHLDVGLLASLGLGAYRFSVSWPRIQPDGTKVEPRGLDFYDRLADELLAQDVKPVLTLYHWDLPQAVEDDGGWLNRDTAARFADYAAVVHQRLGDRVDEWTTLNEPFCAAFLGYGNGVHAPGLADHGSALRAAHHLMLAHGLAVTAMHAQARPSHRFSLVHNFSPVLVAVDDEPHREAARRFDALQNRFFLDAMLGEGYPADLLADVAHLDALEPAIRDCDLEIIAAPVDWLGVNYYAPSRAVPLADVEEPSGCTLPGLRGMNLLPALEPRTSFGWEQTPSSLTDLLVWLHNRTGLPLVVAENGASFTDVVTPSGHVHDFERTRYLAGHIGAVHDAVTAGADVRGYLLWSLLDNFEWSLGYSQRFGIVHVDFDTQERTVKDSGHYFAEVARRNAVVTPPGPALPQRRSVPLGAAVPGPTRLIVS